MTVAQAASPVRVFAIRGVGGVLFSRGMNALCDELAELVSVTCTVEDFAEVTSIESQARAADDFDVDVRPTNDLAEISQKAGVPEAFQGCHTMFVDGYVVDGHVPVNVIRKLLTERPAIAGITLPGMPAGSPGMTGRKERPFTIYAVTKDGAVPTIYATD